MALSEQERLIIETRVATESPGAGVAYALWFFLGLLSAHRIYLGRPVSAVLQIVSYFFLVGFIWFLIDAFLIPHMVQQKRNALRQQFMIEALAHQGVSINNYLATSA